MTALADLSHLAALPHQVGGDPALLWQEYRWIIEQAIADQPRSQQVRIGPSELGTDCLRCLGHKLAGISEARDVAWLPWIGTAVHAQLEETFAAFNAQCPPGETRFLIETTVSVGEVDGVEITGHADLYDRVTRTQSDWKIVGKSTLTAAKANGPSTTYRVQAHLYARGFARRGLPVDRVQVIYLPRNEPTLANAVVWGEPYDEQIALDALRRADALAKAIKAAGPDRVLPGLPAAAGCYSCARYPLPDGSFPAKPGHEHAGRSLQELIA